MTITLNNQAITLSAYCVNDEDALVLCGTTTDWVYVGRGGREDDDSVRNQLLLQLFEISVYKPATKGVP